MTVRPDPRILRAERLRTIIRMPEYEATIGQWLKEAHATVLHNLVKAVEPHDVHRAQGAYSAIQSLMEQFEAVWTAEDAALEKQTKRTTKALEE